MSHHLALPRDTQRFSPRERVEITILSAWFFVITMTLWLLKPIRTAALLEHLGSEELPNLRLGSVLVVGLVVLGYSRVVNRLSRLQLTLAASAVFTVLIASVWMALKLLGETLGQQRWFVWSVYCLVDAYATVMITVFWTYANDVVSRAQADRLYAPIGVGGILGGIAGGAATDSLVHSLGSTHLLLACATGTFLAGVLGWSAEAVLRPAPRALVVRRAPVLLEAFEGARKVLRSNYLLWMVGVVVAYESAAALTEFVINVIFERSFHSELELTQMYGRLGWIVSVTALASQLFIVPVLLPAKRIALLLPPLVMAAATLSLALMPVVSLAIIMAASDRGLNYSLQQVTRETLYVPLGDTERYKAKAFIDMFVDRAAKALASLMLVVVMPFTGSSLLATLVLALGALVFWTRCAHALGLSYGRIVAEREPEPTGQDRRLEPMSIEPKS
jgi:ATP:ADP antiporter, AAA family